MPLANRRPPPKIIARASTTITKQAIANSIPAAGPKETVRLLAVPFEARAAAQASGAFWNAEHKAFLFKGAELPPSLMAYASQPWSWERYKEDELNGVEPSASKPTKVISLRLHQQEAVKAMRRAFTAGAPGFLLADDVGLGKTITAWTGVLATPSAEDVLILCPLAVVAHWRRTIEWMGDGGKRVVIINYDIVKKLFDVPDNITAARGKRRKVRTQKGVVRYGQAVEFDMVLVDESHKTKNLMSARSLATRKIIAGADHTLWLSATAGQTPLELGYLAPLLAWRTGEKVRDLAEFEKWCTEQGIGVTKVKFGKWQWRGDSKDEVERAGAEKDLMTMRRLLFEGPTPAGIRRSPSDIQGWPEINRILLPVSLEAEDRLLYDRAWAEFRHEMELSSKGKDSKNALVIKLRFRQKASLLRTSATVDHALDLLEQGLQVAISVAFMETHDIIKEALEKAGYQVACINGRIPVGEKERQRLDFQHGRATVIVYTVEEGISLHQGEYNNVPRANIIHDLRWSGISMKQIEGRTHRDGRFSQIYWMMGENTVEEGIAAVVAGRMSSMSTMQGDKGTEEDIERLLAGMSNATV